MPHLRTHAGRFYYQSEGEGPPIVLIHGLGSDHTAFVGPVKDALLAGRRVITMDMRGHGRSTRAGNHYSTDQFADDVAALLDTLHIRCADVLGISMGGAIAMKLAARRPKLVNRLALVATWSNCDDLLAASFEEWAVASRNDNQLLRDLVLIRTATPQFVAANRKFIALFNQFWPTASGPAFRKACTACIEHDAAGDLPKIRARTLVIAGTRDLLVPPNYSRDLARQLREAKLKIIDGAGHVPWLDRPDESVRLLTRFFG